MSAALENILEVLKEEAELQVRTEYENTVFKQRAQLDEYQQELERTLADLDNVTLDRDRLALALDALRRNIQAYLDASK